MTVQRQQTQRGFTIVELIITVGILAVLTAFALPTMVTIKRKTEHRSEVGAVVEALQTARADAVIKKKQATTQAPTIKYTNIHPAINIRYDFMGRADVPNNGRCITVTHSKDSVIVSSILVRQVGNPEIFKHKTTCQ